MRKPAPQSLSYGDHAVNGCQPLGDGHHLRLPDFLFIESLDGEIHGIHLVRVNQREVAHTQFGQDLFGSDANKPNLCRSNEITSEVSDYVRACINSGIDPDEPDVFERYFGRKPTPQERDLLQLDGDLLEWWGD